MVPRVFAVLLAVAATGCSTNYNGQVEGVSATPVAPAVPTAATPPVEHPDYAAWKRFKPGTLVKRRSVAERSDNANKVIATETFRLVELTADSVVVERQKTVERVGEDARVDVAPAERRTIASVFALPTGLTAEDFRKPDLKAKPAGEETVKAAGKEYKCKVFKYSNGTEAGAMAITVWWSDDMPGRLVRQTMSTPNGNRTEETVLEVVLP